jgi:hypothetical protein
MTSSTWNYTAVRRKLTKRMFPEINPQAYAIDDVGFPKDGVDSPGMARQYSGALGKVGNCQIGVSVQMVTDHASCAANWRLFLPEKWDEHSTKDPDTKARIRAKRARCQIPDQVRHRTKTQLALDQLDQMTGPGGWDLPNSPSPQTAPTATPPSSASRLTSADSPTSRPSARISLPTPATRCPSTSAWADGPNRSIRTSRAASKPWPWRPAATPTPS